MRLKSPFDEKWYFIDAQRLPETAMRRVYVSLAENQHDVKLMFKRNHSLPRALPVPHI